jgi:hypothetical protein
MDEQINIVGNLLQKKNLNNPTAIKRINTEVNDPQTVSASRVLFHIKREGILDTSSALIVPITMPNATSRLGAYQGALPLISRATLKTSSGKVIAEQNDAGYLMSIYNHFKDDETINRRYIQERGVYNSLKYTSAKDLGVAVSNGDDDIDAKYRVGQTNKTEYQIRLSMLYPQLWPLTLPLFLLNDYLVLEVDFETDANLTSVGQNGVAGVGQPVIDTAGVKLLTDHIIYNDATMNMLRQMGGTNKGISLCYGNYSVVNNMLSAPNSGVAAQVTYRRNVGYAGLRLKHILLHNQQQSGAQTAGQAIGGKVGVSCDSFDESTDNQLLNIRINNVNYFNEDVPTKELYKEVNDCMLTPLNVNISQFTNSVADLFTGDNLFGAPEKTGLRGSACVLGINFSFSKINGTSGNCVTVGSTPIELLYKRKFTTGADNAVNINQRLFTCIERILVIKNGVIFNNF